MNLRTCSGCGQSKDCLSNRRKTFSLCYDCLDQMEISLNQSEMVTALKAIATALEVANSLEANHPSRT